jgi:hypothetical protein
MSLRQAWWTRRPFSPTAGQNGFTGELASLTVYAGPPEQDASRVYNDEKTVAESLVQTWQLVPNDRGNWIICGYSNTSAQLTQKIPADVTRCELTFERNFSLGDRRHPVARPPALRPPHAACQR